MAHFHLIPGIMLIIYTFFREIDFTEIFREIDYSKWIHFIFSDMDVDTAPIIPPTRGYSPYNRSQSEEHILSPCRELLKSTDFSPVSKKTKLVVCTIYN